MKIKIKLIKLNNATEFNRPNNGAIQYIRRDLFFHPNLY